MTSSYLLESHSGVFPGNAQESQKLYDRVAETYDEELKEFGYNGPAVCVNTLEKWFEKDNNAHVMDIACGTGLVGEELIKTGFKNLTIDGVDISSESIRVCEDKKIYNRLICDKIGTDKLDIADGTYDVCLCVGCFIPGHLNQDCFPELIRITKPGGLILIAMRGSYIMDAAPFSEGRFEGAIQSFVQQGTWKVIGRDIVKEFYGKHDGLILVFRVQ